MNLKSFRTTLFCLAAAVLLVSCATGGNSKTKPAVEAPELFEFHPAAYTASINMKQGRYPNLFAPDSFAVWVTSEVSDLKRGAAVRDGQEIEGVLDEAARDVQSGYIVFELHIASVFPDSSIAYDVVGLRNLEVYLETSQGAKIRPIQTILGSHAGEEERGALLKFARTNILVFPKRDLLMDTLLIDKSMKGVRLVIQGFNSEYFFEFRGRADAATAVQQSERERLKAMKVGFKDLFSRLRAISHIFD